MPEGVRGDIFCQGFLAYGLELRKNIIPMIAHGAIADVATVA